ncbi:MAG: hypothetical protein ACE5FG_00395 [Myxococcota bacterium]
MVSEEPSLEPGIEAMIHGWFSCLEHRPPRACGLDRFLAKPSFQLSLLEGTARTETELHRWLSNLRSACSQLHYRIDGVRVEPLEGSLYGVRFEVVRHALDRTGAPHTVRTENIWLVRATSHAPPVIVQIEERLLLSFPGTGPQIICY